LRRSLREIARAIDKFKDAAGPRPDRIARHQGGQRELPARSADAGRRRDGGERRDRPASSKFLRRVPLDPMTRGTEWGKRSYQDKPDTTRWGGQNVFDVYTTFDGKALDGTKYRDW
jgi:general secretion pathway protein G